MKLDYLLGMKSDEGARIRAWLHILSSLLILRTLVISIFDDVTAPLLILAMQSESST